MKLVYVTRVETVPVSVQPLLPTSEPVTDLVFPLHGVGKAFVVRSIVLIYQP